ncbi:EAL domain-containing protein [Hydrogenimonas sp.]
MRYLEIIKKELPSALGLIEREIMDDPMLEEYVQAEDFGRKMAEQKWLLTEAFEAFGRGETVDEHYCWRFYKDFDLPFLVTYKSLTTLKNMMLKSFVEMLDDKRELLEITRFMNHLLNMVSKVYIRKEARWIVKSCSPQKFTSYLLFRAHEPWIEKLVTAIRDDNMANFPLENPDHCRFSAYLEYPESLMICLDINLCKHLHELHEILHKSANNFYLFYAQGEFYQAYLIFEELVKHLSLFNKTLMELYFVAFNNLEESFFNLVELLLYQKGDMHLTLVDIQGLKRLNNRYGETTINKVLARLDERLQALVHENEQKLLLIKGVTADYYLLSLEKDRDRREELFEVIYAVANDLYHVDEREVALTSTVVTLGLAGFYECDRGDLTRMMLHLKELARSDRAHRYVCSDVEKRRIAEWLREYYRDGEFIQRKLDEGAVEVVFQPIYGIESGEIRVLEALARIVDGDRLIPAGVFIDRVIAMGRIEQLDELVLRRLIAQKERIVQVAETLFVNLNFKSLFNDAFKQTFETFMEAFRDHQVVFELTEQTLVENMQSVVELSERLGVSFAVDDFGSGYSSLKTVSDLSRSGVLKVLKLDGTLVKGLEADEQNRKIVKVIADLSETMDLLSVAEFVENGETLDHLKAFGITYAQGYYLSQPKRIEALLIEKLERDASRPKTGTYD